MQTRRKWALAGLAVGLVFLYLALLEADLPAAWAALQETRPAWAAVVLGCGLGFMAVKTLRWSCILTPLSRVSFGTLHRAVYMGTAANLVVAHSGELLRATLVSRKGGLAASTVLGTIAVERILDFAALLAITGVALLWDPSMSPVLLSAGLLSLAIVSAGVLGVLAFLSPTPTTRRLGRAVLRPLPSPARTWVSDRLRNGVAGLGTLNRPRALLRVMLLSLLQWACIVAAVWASAAAVGLSVPVPAAIAVFVLTVIGLTLPSSPAQLGTTQLAFVVGLELAGASGAAAFAASLVYTLFVVLAMMLIGAAWWLLAAWSPAAARLHASHPASDR